MKFVAKIALLASLALGFVACHGQSDDGSVEVKLTPSVLTIEADGSQTVTFEVTYGGTVVNQESEIVLLSHPKHRWDGRNFMTKEVGEYIFQATYRDMQSNQVTITAVEPAPLEASRFERHICVIDLTGTWCSFCPDGMQKLNYYVQKKEWKDIVHVIAIHDNTQGDDPMGIPISSVLMKDFGNYGYPMFITDMRDSGSLTENVADIVPSFERSLEEHPAHCGIKISSSLVGRTLKCETTLYAETLDKYSMTLFLVEDDIVAPQKDGSITHQDYKHHHVVRYIANEGLYDGYMGSFSSMAADKEAHWTHEYVLPEEWNTDNMSIVVVAYDSTKTVNNVAECAVGESVGFKYLDKQ